MYSNGNSFGESAISLGASAGNAVGVGVLRWPFPPWRCFGLRQSDDRGCM